LGNACYHSLEYFIFLSDIQKHKAENIQSCILPHFVTLREGCGLRMFKNRVLRIIFGFNVEELIGDRRKLQSEQLHTFNFSPNIWMINSTAGRVACMGEMGNVYRVLVIKHEWNRSPVRSRH
jgi:hypothetical protein